MIYDDELPASLIQRAMMMESILTAAATEGSSDSHIYEHLRGDFMLNDELKGLLPAFVRTYRDLRSFRS